VRYTVVHQTTYEYEQEVSISHHLLRLAPRGEARQHCFSHTVALDPSPGVIVPRLDMFGNPVTFVTLEGAHRQLQITSHSEVEVEPGRDLDPSATNTWESVRQLCQGDTVTAGLAAVPFTFASPLVPRRAGFGEYARISFTPDRPILAAALELNRRIFGDFKYDPRATTVTTPVEEVFRQRRGVCQDFAHFGLACLRSLGLPARYVSGYLETRPAPGRVKLAGADASHAWLSVWCPPFGWVDLDPTNNIAAGERHVTLGWGRDYNDVCPVRGVIVGGGRHQLRVAVDVKPVPG
jgi:transglutaminase-like putative cysteine protease